MATTRNAPAEKQDSSTTKAVVLFDGIRHVDADGGVRFASKGAEVDLTSSEFDRLSKLDAVAKPSSKDAKAAQAEADELPDSDKPSE